MTRLEDEALTQIEYLLGYSVFELRRRIAAGWTLEPPKKPESLQTLNELSLDEFVGNFVRNEINNKKEINNG